MSWLVVAKKDFQDSLRSKTLWALIALFILLMGGLAYVFTLLQNGGGGNESELTSLGLITLLISPVALLVPITGLIVGHKSLIGEVESGSIKFLLSMPHSRLDAMIGKIAGRSGVLSVGVIIGVVVATVVALVFYDETSLDAIATFTLLTLLFGVVYTVIGVSISAVSSSESRATTYAFAFFAIFEIFWGVVPMGIHYLLDGAFFPPAGGTPGWYSFLQRIPPSSSYTFAVDGFSEELQLNAGGVFDTAYLSEWAMLALLLFWLVVPPILGYLRFRSVDL